MASSPAPTSSSSARISLVVCASDPTLRLRWLLNSIAAQIADADSFELVVVHDPLQPEVAEMVDAHPLARSVLVRRLCISPVASPAARRNRGWQAATHDAIGFGAPDLRLAPTWISEALAERAAGVIREGRVLPDPLESNLMRTPLSYTWQSAPPARNTPATNIVCGRDVLERCDGFDEALDAGPFDGSVLAARARRAGATLVPAPGLIAYAAVYPVAPAALIARLTSSRNLAAVVARYPELGLLVPASPLMPAQSPASSSRRHVSAPALAALSVRWAAWKLGALSASDP